MLGVAAYIRYEPGGTGTLPDGRASAADSGGRRVADARIVLGGIAPSPIEVNEAGKELVGHQLDDDHIRAAAEAAYIKARPLDNTDFVYQWRKQMARQYTIRALQELRTQGR